MNVAEISARVAARGFRVLGAPAEYLRKAGGETLTTRVIVNRDYETEGHISQRRISVVLPLAAIGNVERGDVITAENEGFEVQRESHRDADTLTVIVRAVA